jgi:hypothetical protein
MLLPPPTWMTLRDLAAFDSADEAIAWAATRRVERSEPELVTADGTRTLIMPDRTRFVWSDDRWQPSL